MTDKIVNYTKAATTALVAAYVAATTDAERKTVVTEQAAELGKNAASVRAKLVREGVYVKAERTTKTGAKVQKKGEIVDAIAAAMNQNAEVMESLEKATKKVLEMVLVAVTPAEVATEATDTNESE